MLGHGTELRVGTGRQTGAKETDKRQPSNGGVPSLSAKQRSQSGGGLPGVHTLVGDTSHWFWVLSAPLGFIDFVSLCSS